MGTHKIYSGIQGIRDNISGSLYGDCHELLARKRLNQENNRGEKSTTNRKRHLKSEFAHLQSSSILFNFI